MKTLIANSNSFAPSDTVDTPDLDVTPIMNMFIILIPFLVSMAVFTHLAVIECNLPPNINSGLDASRGNPKLKMTVVVSDNYLAITLGENLLDSIPSVEGEYNMTQLSLKLEEQRRNAEIENKACIAVRDGVRFKHVVKVMDICRTVGFEKIGLSNAPDKERFEKS